MPCWPTARNDVLSEVIFIPDALDGPRAPFTLKMQISTRAVEHMEPLKIQLFSKKLSRVSSILHNRKQPKMLVCVTKCECFYSMKRWNSKEKGGRGQESCARGA